jgi:hypothetical protein
VVIKKFNLIQLTRVCSLQSSRFTSSRNNGVNMITYFGVIEFRVVTDDVINENLPHRHVLVTILYRLDLFLRKRRLNLVHNVLLLQRSQLRKSLDGLAIQLLLVVLVVESVVARTFFVFQRFSLHFYDLPRWIRWNYFGVNESKSHTDTLTISADE